MAYTGTAWEVGDAITKERMNKIHEGLQSAYSSISTNASNISSLNTSVTTLNGKMGTAEGDISALQNDVSTIGQQSIEGHKAWAQVSGAITMEGDLVIKSLNQRFSDDETLIGSIGSEVSAARRGKENLVSKITEIDNNISSLSGGITSINDTFAQAYNSTLYGNYGSVHERIEADETRIHDLQQEVNTAHQSTAFNRTSDPYGSLDARFEDGEGRIVAIRQELDNAHESTALNKTGASAYASIDARFEAIEEELTSQNSMSSRLDTIEGNVSGLADNKVNKTDIANNLTTETAGKVLDATQGKALKDALDSMDTAYKAADTALDSRLDAIDGGSALDTTNGTLAIRVSALETTIDTTDTGLSDRLAVAEGDIDDLEAELDTATTGVKARITALENTVDTSTTGLSDRMTAAEQAISHAVASGDTGGLTERITAVEGEIDTAQTGIKARLTALETTVDTTTTGLVDRVSSIEDDLDTAVTGLKARVTTLEGKDTVIIPYDGEHSNYTNNVPNYTTPTENADYLIADDEDKYFYWRYIDSNWELISGAGGGGTGSSSGRIIASLDIFEGANAETPDVNTDYFVGNNNDGYTHYRYIAGSPNGQFVKILPNDLINSLGVATVSIENGTSDDQWPTGESFSGGLTAYNLGDDETNLLEDFVAVRNARIQAVYDENDELQSQKLQVLDTNGKLMEYDIVGGGGTSNLYTARIESSTAANRSIPANSSDPVTISAKVIIQQGQTVLPNATAEGAIQYRRRNTSTWNTGSRIEVTADTEDAKYIIPNDTVFTVDITKYLVEDVTMEFRFALIAYPAGEEDALNVYSSTFRVTKVNISIADEAFDYASVKNSNFQFNYRCFGSGIAKTVHFLVDGTDVVTPVNTSSHNTILQQVIPMTGKANGMHTFQVYFITSTGLESNRLNYYILYNTDNSRQAPLIGAAAANTSITDGDELIVNYSVYTAGQETTDEIEIELYTMDNGTKNSIQIDTLNDVPNNILANPPYRTFNYPKVVKDDPNSSVIPDPITVYVKLTASHTVDIEGTPTVLTDSQTVSVQVNYLNTNYDLEPKGTNNLLYSYVAYGRSNNDANKETYTYTYTTVGGQSVNFTGTFNNFNWSTDGYADGQCLTIGGGASLDINVPIFSSTFNNVNLEENAEVQDITQIGRTIEIDYEVESATDLNAIIMKCMNADDDDSSIGFRVTPQSCYLLNSSAKIELDDSGFILNEDQIAAAYLTPGQRIHLVFVIEPWATDAARDASFDGEYHQSTNIYVNGEFANTCPYNRDKITGNLAGNNFSTNATIHIGSDSCLIKLYSIKLYNRGLTQEQVLQNYKVAPVATRDKLTRLEENDILNVAGQVDYEKAKRKYNCLLLTGPAPTDQTGNVVPTISPYKGSPSPAGRTDKKTGDPVGKTESGLTLTKPSATAADGYTVEFDLQDTIPAGQAAYLGAVGSYCSSNNVQGTSSQKYPTHNLKIYLAKWQPAEEAVYEEQEVEDPETHEITTEQVLVKEAVSAGIAKVKYCLKGKDNEGNDLGTSESTLCWKADYMSTDHANTFNANVADKLFKDKLTSDWDSKKYQNTVYGIRCLLFQKQGDNAPVFVGDGCLNNDKGNSKTFGLEQKTDDGTNTSSQKWEFTNNSEDLGYFKTDDLFAPLNNSIRAKNGFESTYPDEGDLEDDGLTPNYNHLQILLTWVSKRANYWDEADASARAAKKAIFRNEFTRHFNLNHVLTYYLFLQYTALCDNRVKNMFMRSDNIKQEVILNTNSQELINGNNFPQDDTEGTRWSTFVETTGANAGTTHPEVIDWTNSTFAVWAPVLYDLDSCFGVENVGLIKIRYDADWDYEWKGTPQFNGYNSIFWLMVEDTFKDELAALALTLYNQSPGLNFRTFNQQQIIENQQQISPALTNQDMIMKYDKPWSEGFINYAETPDNQGNYPKQTPLYKYLQRGSRAAQKSQFMQQRSMLLSSYYGADEFLNSSIKFRTGVPVGASGNVIGYIDDDPTKPIYGNGDLTETQITIKANQILYPGVAYGDNKPATRVLTNDGKVNADTSCTIQATSAVQGNDGIFIYGASVLTDIGDISKFKPLQLDVSAGVNLKRLIIGSNASGYSNNTTNSITGLNKCILLEEINVRNLKQMSTLTLTSNGFIKDVYAAGSGIGTISLPQGGVLETIEYGANTTDITIINQSRLTSFSYEGSNENYYGNVTRLWVENTPNVPVEDIVIARLGDLQAGGLRLVGIDLNLGSDATFLQKITSDLAKGTYLSARGGHTEGTEDYPYISGTVRITTIRQSLLAKLNELYPDLVINYNQREDEYEVTYEDYDGTVLFTDHGISTDPVKDPVYDINPITNLPYIEMPTKPDDIQYKYKFGTYDGSNNYRRYSGWVRKNTTINPTSDSRITSTLTYVAYYPTIELQRYTVRWFAESNDSQPLLEYTEDYGTPIGTFNQPEDSVGFVRAKQVGNMVKVFKGWNRPVGKLTGNIDVYAQWETSTINDDTQNIVMENLTAADVYALATQVTSSRKDTLIRDGLHIGEPIMIRMGQDFDYTEGVTTVNLLGNATRLKYEGSQDGVNIYNDVKPLALNQDWTLAIDYQFLLPTASVLNNGQEFVLASCYSNVNGSIQGFKLSLIRGSDNSSEKAIQVSWGTATQVIDWVTVDTNNGNEARLFSKTYRNMIVLAHNADNPNNLVIYYAQPLRTNTNASAGADYGTNVTSTTLTWSNNELLDTPLIFGGNYNGASTNIESNSGTRRPAHGIIYWAKYWTANLGSKNCMALAAWPHEIVPFYLTGYNGTSGAIETIYDGAELSFVAAQGIGSRYAYALKTGGSEDSNYQMGWHVSHERAICSNLIYKGMPTAYQSIIRKTTLNNSTAVVDGQQVGTTVTVETQDYLFLPALREVTAPNYNYQYSNSIWTNEVNTNWSYPWHWMVLSNLTNIYEIENETILRQKTISSSNNQSIDNYRYYRYWFSGNYIKPTARIFEVSSDPSNTNWTLNSAITRVQSGDVWINDNKVAYMYFTAEEIANGQKVDIIAASTGGWKRADIWTLRTYGPALQTSTDNGFVKVNYTGEIIPKPTQSTAVEQGRLLCPEFTV